MTGPVLAALVAAAVAVIAALGAWLSARRLRRSLENRGPDPSVAILQRGLESNLRLLQAELGQAAARVDARLHENAETLRKTNQALGERLDNAAQVIGRVQQTLGGLDEATKRVYEVGKDIASLQDILRSPKLRGGLGELLLGELLAQVLPSEHYALQHEFASGEKVDAVIKIGKGLVPVDAKFPLEDFRRSLEAESDGERTRARKAFAVRVKKHIDAVASKYILPDEGTYDFALLYVPAENVYYETIVRSDSGEDEGINAYALERRVIPVSPGSFFAYLQAILVGLKGLRVEQGAREILAHLSRLTGDLERFREDFRLIGKHLGNASASFASAEKRLERLVERMSSPEFASQSPEGAQASGHPSVNVRPSVE